MPVRDLIVRDIIMCIFPFAAAFVFAAVSGLYLIPWLHKLKFGQEIREEGPNWHQKKSGTPTMGGIMFIVGMGLSLIIMNIFHAQPKMILMYCISLGFGFIGFVDDYIKVVKKRNLGLTAPQKFGMQLFLTAAYLIVLYLLGELSTDIYIPFVKVTWTMPLWLYVVMAFFVVTGTVNAVNLTDGLDGLASSITIVVGTFFAVASGMARDNQTMIYSILLVGGTAGFLLYNHYPAKVFMGDTGSLFLGGAISVIAIGLKMPLILIIAGFVYLFEALSVIMQVTSYKLTKKRIFKMAPVHHHFEMCGWNEKKIVAVFTAVTFVLCVIAVLAIMPGLGL